MRSSSASILSRMRAVSGFSFVELAVGMAVLGIVLSGGLMAASKKWGADQRAETRQYLRDTKTALLDYARKNGRLPMMDTSGDGVSENWDNQNAQFVTSSPNPIWPGAPQPWLPYKTLGVKDRDAFGRKVQYVVNWQLTQPGNKPCKALKNFFKGNVSYARYYAPSQGILFTTSFSNAANPWWPPPSASFPCPEYAIDSKWDDPNPIKYTTNLGIPGYYQGWYPTTNWFPVFKTGQHYEYFTIAALLVSSANDGAFVGPDQQYVSTGYKLIVPYDFFIPNDDIKLDLSLPEIYAALGCSN